MNRYIFFLMLIVLSNPLLAVDDKFALGDIFSKDIEELINIKVDTVLSASKTDEKIHYAPAAVTVFNRYQIEAFGCRTLADILNLVRGFYITYDYNYHYTGIRGLYKPGDYNSRILLLIDGHQINDNIYDQAFIGTDFLLDIDLIDRIEVIRGPASSLYGGNALFGVINIITRNLDSQEFAVSYGSNDTYKMRLTLSHNPEEKMKFMASATYYRSLGADLYFKELEARGYGDGRNYIGDYDRYPSFFAKSTLGELTVFGGYISRTKGIPTGAWGVVFNDKRNKSVDNRGFFELRYDKKFEENLGLMVRFFYDSYEYEGHYVYEDDIQRESDRGGQIGAEVKGSIEKSKYNFNIGFEIRDSFMQNLTVYSEENGYTFDLRHDSFSSGVYLGFIYNLLSNLRLNLSSRYDYFEYYDDALSSRFALIYSFDDKSVFKLIAGNAYRPPNIYETYYNDNGLTQKAPDHLNSEMIYQTEVVYEYYFSEDMSMNTAIYYSDIENMIGFGTDPLDGLIVASNLPSFRLIGFEWRSVYSSQSGRMLSMNYNYSHLLDDVQNSFPQHMIKIRGAYPLFQNRLIPAFSFNFISSTKTIRNNDIDPAFFLNLNLLYKGIYDHFDLSLGIYNLLNQKYYVPASVEHNMDSIVQQGATYLLKLGGYF